MSYTSAIRELEKHIKTLAKQPAEQIRIISKAQSLITNDEKHLTMLGIVKRIIIKKMQNEAQL
jgi:hypothetical protein